MRLSHSLTAFACAAVALAAPPSAAHAQPTLARVAAGPLVTGGLFPDAGFQHAYSFRASAFAPGSADAGAIAGGSGACQVGDACQSSVARDYLAGESTYGVGITFGGDFTGSPSLYVNSINTNTAGAELLLDGYVPDSPLNAFYVVLTAPAGGSMALSNAWFIGAPPVGAPGFATAGPGSWYALFRYADLRNEFLFFDLDMAGNVAGAGAPSIEIYVGTLPLQAVPEPATLGLTITGLAGVLAVARRRGVRLAVSRTASSPRR